MTRSPVYCALIEIEPLDGCELDPVETAGASVRCYIPAVDTECAISLLTNTLRDMKMALVETEWCVDYDNTEWENPGDQTEEAFVADARESGTIVFGTFHSWGHGAPDVA